MFKAGEVGVGEGRTWSEEDYERKETTVAGTFLSKSNCREQGCSSAQIQKEQSEE